MNLQSFINNLNQGIISILFCEDGNSNDSLVGLDFGTIDGILCFGEVDEKKNHKGLDESHDLVEQFLHTKTNVSMYN